VAVGMLSANAVSFFRNPFSSAGRPQGSIGHRASVRDGARPNRAPTLACSCLSVGDCQNASTAFRVHTAKGQSDNLPLFFSGLGTQGATVDSQDQVQGATDGDTMDSSASDTLGATSIADDSTLSAGMADMGGGVDAGAGDLLTSGDMNGDVNSDLEQVANA